MDCAHSEDFIRVVAGFALGLIGATALAVMALIAKLLLFRRKENFSVFALASVLLGLALGLIGAFVVPAFEQVFTSFGASLPAPTKFVLAFRHFLWMPLLLIALSWLPARTRRARARRHDLACFLAQALLLCLVFWGLYAPIFNSSCIR
jgi:type IV pilus assembly protein PilC